MHFESQRNLYRETLSINTTDKKEFLDGRESFLKNFDSFISNLNLDYGSDALQEQVDSYIDQ